MEFFGPFLSLGIHCLWAWGCFSLAERKGRSGALAAIMGFFFGLFAYLVYWALSDNSYRSYDEGGFGAAPRNLPPAPQRTCWSCSTPVGAQVAVCQSCGVRLQF